MEAQLLNHDVLPSKSEWPLEKPEYDRIDRDEQKAQRAS